MKAGRYFRGSEIRPFFLDSTARIFDWSVLDCSDVPDQVRRALMAALRSGSDEDFLSAVPEIEEWIAVNPKFLQESVTVLDLPVEVTQVPLPPPVRPRNFVCVGLNYRDHARESEMKIPLQPLLFAKTSNAITGHNCKIDIPPQSEQLDFEAELAVIIGRTCRSVRAADVMQYVAGYTCVNDVSARDFQFTDGQWFRGKSCDGFAPLGPWLATKGDVPDHRVLRIQCRLNNQLMQDSTTQNLIFDIPVLIEFISTFITLEPGDVIATGTPPGVGFARKPPIYLKDGDRIEVDIENVGLLCNTVRRNGGSSEQLPGSQFQSGD
jgi:2-keto-4-pentenoate hydratase/2-oxohepta-3-ene-1,7-dioic acid hydratase in catechol pathway